MKKIYDVKEFIDILSEMYVTHVAQVHGDEDYKSVRVDIDDSFERIIADGDIDISYIASGKLMDGKYYVNISMNIPNKIVESEKFIYPKAYTIKSVEFYEPDYKSKDGTINIKRKYSLSTDVSNYALIYDGKDLNHFGGIKVDLKIPIDKISFIDFDTSLKMKMMCLGRERCLDMVNTKIVSVYPNCSERFAELVDEWYKNDYMW